MMNFMTYFALFGVFFFAYGIRSKTGLCFCRPLTFLLISVFRVLFVYFEACRSLVLWPPPLKMLARSGLCLQKFLSFVMKVKKKSWKNQVKDLKKYLFLSQDSYYYDVCLCWVKIKSKCLSIKNSFVIKSPKSRLLNDDEYVTPSTMKLTTWIRNHVSSSRTSEFWTRKKETIFPSSSTPAFKQYQKDTPPRRFLTFSAVQQNSSSNFEPPSRRKGRTTWRPWGRGLPRGQDFELAAWKTCHSLVSMAKEESKRTRQRTPCPQNTWTNNNLAPASFDADDDDDDQKTSIPMGSLLWDQVWQPLFYSMLVSLPESALLVFVKLGLIVWKNRAKGLKSRLYHMWCFEGARLFREIRSIYEKSDDFRHKMSFWFDYNRC